MTFLDVEFPPNDTSLYGSSAKADKSRLITWRRPHEFMTGDIQLFDTIEPNDIKQGALGDCWFLCSVSALTEYPEMVVLR